MTRVGLKKPVLLNLKITNKMLKTNAIETIKICFDLLVKIKGSKEPIYILDIARELKIKQTDLMQFILDNSNLFHCYEGKKTGKLVISRVYLSAIDNWQTEEWLDHQIKIKEKYFYVSEYDNYGYMSGYYIAYDEEKDDKLYLWRNTKVKVDDLKEKLSLKPASYNIGGMYDSGTIYPNGYEITSDQLDLLKLEGYTFNDYRPLSK